MKRLVVTAVALLAMTGVARGFGYEGHQAIGQLARGLLSSPARAAVQAILGDGRSLATIATWPDDLKEATRGRGPLADDEEAARFNRDFPDNGEWHFVNLPLGVAGYTDDGTFSGAHDIAHVIRECIDVLEGTSSRFTKLQALRFLVHLVGDIHQPLHVATGYYKFNRRGQPSLITDPAKAKGAIDDRGANDLFFTADQELHGYWDTSLVEEIAGKDYHALAATLAAKSADRAWTQAHPADWATPGDYHAWAERWATDSVKEANAAYAGIEFGRASFDSHHRLRRIPVTLPDQYAAEQLDRVTVQLVKGGVHLAALLNAIRWPK